MGTPILTKSWVGLLCAIITVFSVAGQSNPVIPFSRVAEIDLKPIFSSLEKAPSEKTIPLKDAAVTVKLPYLIGERIFKVVSSPIMSPEFAAQFPYITTYAIQAIDEPTVIGRLTFSPIGVYATILTPQGAVTIQPTDFDTRTRAHKISIGEENLEHPFQLEGENFCGQTDEHINPEYAKFLKQQQNKGLEKVFTYPSGSSLRTYRLAIVVTGEFYEAHGGTALAVNTVITSIVSGIQTIFDLELAVRFSLLTPVLYTDDATDIFTPAMSRTDQAAIAINTHFVSGDYDLGHVFHIHADGDGWSNGGVAGLGVVCRNTNWNATGAPAKAAGWSGNYFSNGIPSFIRLATHEFGHQFGMEHTFNGTGSSCTAAISLNSAYEIASGTTIMAYRGICEAAQNIPGSVGTADNYFHTRSLSQAIDYINNLGNCASSVANGNTPPVVNAKPCGGSYTLPIGTPFSMTGAATDAYGDNLTYTWEQYDEDGIGVKPTQGKIGNDAATDPLAPLFRSYPPSSSPTRTFPALTYILNNNNTYDFEALPLVDRTLHFRLTVRDNNPVGGGVEFDDVSVTVDDAYGPLAVTAPNTAVTWDASMTQTVTWDVNSTNTLAANIVISLSVDGGNTFPYILGTFTNDGSEMITLPAGVPNTTTARIKVAGVINNCFSFFDISNVNFTITSSCLAATNSICQTDAMAFPQGDPGLDLDLLNIFGSLKSSHSVTVDTGDPSVVRAIANAQGSTTCTTVGSRNYESFKIVVNTTGSYTLNISGTAFTAVSIFEATGFNPANPCASTFLGSNAFSTGGGGASNFSLASFNLEKCTEYIVMVYSSAPLPNTVNITFSGTGNIYVIENTPGVDYSYTYLAVNTSNNQVAAVSASSNFTSLGQGTYEVYGAAYYSGAGPTPATVNPATWVGQTLSNILSGGSCVSFSTNFKSITILPADYGDLANTWPQAQALVIFTDANNNGVPDGTGSAVWAGTLIDTESAQQFSSDALGDDNNNNNFNDEDGLTFPAGNLVPGQNYNFTINTNSNSSTSITRYYKLWFDWNNDNTFEDSYSGSVVGTGVVAAVRNVTVSPSAVTSYKIRLIVDDSDLTSATPDGTFTNAEIEDYNNTTALPIELLTFKALADQCDVMLYWETASEKNVGYFQLEASKDGRQFEMLGQLKPASPNSSTKQTYKYAVPFALQRGYYRIKTVDLDESFEYSPLVFAEAPCKKSFSAILYPNPNTTSALTVEINSSESYPNVQFQVLDNVGRVIRTQQAQVLEGIHKVTVPTGDLPTGIYYIRIVGTQDTYEPLRFVRTKN